MRKLLLFLFASVYVLSLRAERIDLTTAQQVAENVMEGNASLRSSGPEKLSLAYVAYSGNGKSGLRNGAGQGDADFYVFNAGNDAGFIIVAGENRVRPVLGYATKGHFDPIDVPDNMNIWLKHYQSEVKYAVEKNIRATVAVREEWDSLLRNSVGITSKVILKTAEWGQDDPFNRKCRQ